MEELNFNNLILINYYILIVMIIILFNYIQFILIQSNLKINQDYLVINSILIIKFDHIQNFIMSFLYIYYLLILLLLLIKPLFNYFNMFIINLSIFEINFYLFFQLTYFM